MTSSWLPGRPVRLSGRNSFVRGNIAVSVNSVGSVTIDVSEIAAIVDRLLTEPPAMPSLREWPNRDRRKRFSSKVRKRAAGERLKKVGDGWLKVMIPDGELRRKGDAVIYISRQPGKKVVRIYAINVRTA